jgi:hypothetical protein
MVQRMKKVFLCLLMLLMLLPGMVCAMPVCMHGLTQAKAAAGAPGHTHHGHGLVFFKDCANTDLQTASYDVIITRPDTSSKALVTAGANIFQDGSVHPGNLWTIRDPPPDWPDGFSTRPSLLLTTQRLRQ